MNLINSNKQDSTIDDPIKANPNEFAIKLIIMLGPMKLVKLVELLEDVIEKTGYGDVKIVVAEGKVQMLKAEHSYK